MKIHIKGILEGAYNSIFVKEEIEEIAKKRTEICEGCKYNSKNPDFTIILRPDVYCTMCGCNIHMKTRSLSEQCPLDPPKWKKEVTDEEDEKIQDFLTKNDETKS